MQIEIGQRRESLDRLGRQIAVGHRVSDGDDALAGILEAPATARVVWDLPTPVRTAVTATVGTVALSIVASGPRSTKLAPAAITIEALCITYSCLTSE